jgi:hypothetical protein
MAAPNVILITHAGNTHRFRREDDLPGTEKQDK